jgi:hypothetical protein
VSLCLSTRGACEEAAALLRECLDATRTDLGAEHPATMDVTDALADVLLDKGSFKEAEQLLATCLENSKRLLGTEHPKVRWLPCPRLPLFLLCPSEPMLVPA